MKRSLFPFSPFTRYLFPALVGMLGFTVGPAHAQEEPGAGSAERARVLITKGNLALRKGDEVMARKHYRDSFRLQESFDAVCNLGGVEARSKLHVDAYEHLQLCLHL